MSLSATMHEALNQHLNHELGSSYIYLSMAASLAALNFPGASHWMHLQAQEELGHAMKFYDFINDRDCRVTLHALPAPPSDWKTLLEVFQAALEHEKLMSERINTLVDLSLTEKDHASNSMLQWLVTEQIEEEAMFSGLIHKLKLVGGDGSGLFMIDQELGKRVATPTAPQA